MNGPIICELYFPDKCRTWCAGQMMHLKEVPEYAFQDKFIDCAKLYYKRTGKALRFVPMYIAPNLHTAFLGEPTPFHPEAPIEEERTRLCRYLMDPITAMALAQPRHKIVPYRNIPGKQYPYNIPTEVTCNHETPSC